MAEQVVKSIVGQIKLSRYYSVGLIAESTIDICKSDQFSLSQKSFNECEEALSELADMYESESAVTEKIGFTVRV